MKKETEFNLRKKRRELFEKELVGRPNGGRIYRKIIAQDKQFIKEILEEVQKIKESCRVFGFSDEDDKYNEDYEINCRGVLEELEKLKQKIKQKSGDKLKQRKDVKVK